MKTVTLQEAKGIQVKTEDQTCIVTRALWLSTRAMSLAISRWLFPKNYGEANVEKAKISSGTVSK